MNSNERGVEVGPHLSFLHGTKMTEGYAEGKNRTREIRPSGIAGGLVENVNYGEWLYGHVKRKRRNRQVVA